MEESDLSTVTSEYVHTIVDNLPASEKRLRIIQEQQDKDPICKQLKSYCVDGEAEWKGPLKPYYHVRAELTVAEGLFMRGNRMVIPTRAEILEKTLGHFFINIFLDSRPPHRVFCPLSASRNDEVLTEGKRLCVVAWNQERY